jgi:hypothetical protein
MPSLSPDGELQRLTATAYTPQDDVHERLKALALQMTLEYQRLSNGTCWESFW